MNLNNNDKMPVLFLGHGSPMNAIEENIFVDGFRDLAAKIPKPKAILCVSAHWFIAGTKVTAMENPRTIHDFGGFPRELHAVEYPAKGDPALAQKVKELLSPVDVELDYKWGLDHGAWSVIKHLYPNADVPVVQLSIDYTKNAEYHYRLAKNLAPLRDESILVVASGNIVHNLAIIDFEDLEIIGRGYDWAFEARDIVNALIKSEDIDSLIHYENLGRAIELSVPSPEHYLPLLYALALKEESDSVRIFNDELVGGSLSMTSLEIS